VFTFLERRFQVRQYWELWVAFTVVLKISCPCIKKFSRVASTNSRLARHRRRGQYSSVSLPRCRHILPSQVRASESLPTRWAGYELSFPTKCAKLVPTYSSRGRANSWRGCSISATHRRHAGGLLRCQPFPQNEQPDCRSHKLDAYMRYSGLDDSTHYPDTV
jgi:hypothetical protein